MCELAKLIRHFFPDLIPLLKQLPDPRHQSYITYPAVILLMTRILSSIFYISSMRKTSEELNSDTMIENIWELCGEKPRAEELPYWETINRYLKKMDPEKFQDILCRLCRRLIRSRAFENARIRGKYWQVIIDGTQIHSTRRELDGKCMYRIHNRGTPEEYKESYYYVLEAKLVLHPEIIVSIMTEFVENTDGGEAGKQDCERKACWRLMERLEKEFPRLNLCICADSLYACGRFLQECADKNWKYILRFKEGSIPTAAEEYEKLRKITGNGWEKALGNGKAWYDYVEGIEHNGYKTSLVEYREERQIIYKKGAKKGRKKLSVPHKFIHKQEKCTRPGGVWAYALENRERGFQHPEKAGVPSRASVQPGLPGPEVPLLPDTDRAYDSPGIGSMGKTVEKCKAEQRAET